MSKRLQITLPDDFYEMLIEMSKVMPVASKSSIICASIDELYKKLDSNGLIKKNEPCR